MKNINNLRLTRVLLLVGLFLLISAKGLGQSSTTLNATVIGTGPFTYSWTPSSQHVNASVEDTTTEKSGPAVIMANLSAPTVIITNPAPVCSPATADLTAYSVTAGSTANISYTYWINAGATRPLSTPATIGVGTYYIKGTTSSGCFDIKPVIVTVRQNPVADAGPDQVLENLFYTSMDAKLDHEYETGVWSLKSGTGEIFDTTYAKTSVSKLSPGKNKFLWKVTNGVCSPSLDSVSITVHDLIIPTLMTPNMDGKNDFFVVEGSDPRSKTELKIFDKRGVKVYENMNYDNSWNGVDYKGNPLFDDTYFYFLKTKDGKFRNGFIIIRR